MKLKKLIGTILIIPFLCLILAMFVIAYKESFFLFVTFCILTSTLVGTMLLLDSE